LLDLEQKGYNWQMNYLNNNFWRMILGFLIILVLAMGLFFVFSYFDKTGNPIPAENNYAQPPAVDNSQ
jgi:multisubunit Na+/H+ antiporter MnhC subunit